MKFTHLMKSLSFFLSRFPSEAEEDLETEADVDADCVYFNPANRLHTISRLKSSKVMTEVCFCGFFMALSLNKFITVYDKRYENRSKRNGSVEKESTVSRNDRTENRRNSDAGSSAEGKNTKKGHLSFRGGDVPKSLFLLIQGKVTISQSTMSGRRILLTDITRSGDLFGEVYLFIGKEAYDMDAQAVEDSEVLEIAGEIPRVLWQNMLEIFLQKGISDESEGKGLRLCQYP